MTPWDRARTALSLLAIDPVGLGGIVVRGRRLMLAVFKA